MARGVWRETFSYLQLRTEQEEALGVREEEDAVRSNHIVSRALSDATRGFRLCPLKVCRRARRCVNETCLCQTLRHKPVLAPPYRDFLIDEVFKTLQAQRKTTVRGRERQ